MANKQKAGGKGRPTPSSKSNGAKEAKDGQRATELQQKCLNLFRDAFRPDPNETTTLQEVKGHLYNRDFASAFGKKEYLEVYAARWSPSRALCYHQIFTDLQSHILSNGTNDTDHRTDESNAVLRVVALGGGAGAEVAALGSWWSTVITPSDTRAIKATFIDIADWSSIIDNLHRRVVEPPELSKYASEAAKVTNTALLSRSAFHASFLQQDLLNLDNSTLIQTLKPAHLVTLMFTLNELYSASLPDTQAFLSHLTTYMAPDSLLLVVDSPGSYSTISINGTEKKYPMQWLLDHSLIGPATTSATNAIVHWEKLESDNPRWFRLPAGLRYPIDLENMRYQIHLYKRLPT